MVYIDTVVQIVAHACILLCSAILYVFLITRILPHLMLRPQYDLSVLHERGIRKYVFRKGRAIVYEPSVQASRFINQYILSCNDGEKYIKCKLDPRVEAIKLDVVAMDANDKVISVVQIAEPILDQGYTRGAILPHNTSYVSVIVKEVNGRLAEPVYKLRLPMRNAVLYVLLTVLCSVIEGALWNASILKWFDMALREFVGAQPSDFLRMLLVYAVVGLAVSVATVLFHCSKDVKLGK